MIDDPTEREGEPAQNDEMDGGYLAASGDASVETDAPSVTEADEDDASVDNFAGEGSRLRLLPAPGMLCEGTAEDKECDEQQGCRVTGDYGVDAGVAKGEPRAFRSPAAPPSCDRLDDDTPYTLYMSADDSNSMAAPVIARWMIRKGQTVPPDVVRAHEFFNYYNFDFEPAKAGEVDITAQLSSCPNEKGQLSFQVALQSEKRSREERAPLNITLIVDESGSMSGTPIALERKAVRVVAGQLKAGDVVSMVTWDVKQNVILAGHEVTGPDDPVLLDAADGLRSGGGTNLAAGLAKGYELANEHRSRDRINRVILISDGQANVGVTDEKMIARHADDEETEGGIYLAGIGVGNGYNDTLMDVVTDAGRGAYVFIDNESEIERMLGDRFLEVIDVAARAVRLEVTLPWYLSIEKFYGEVVSEDPEMVRPQHLGPNDAMVFFQILRACDPRLLHGDDRIRLRATWETPFTRESKKRVFDATFNEMAGNDENLDKAAAIATYTDALVRAFYESENRRAVLQQAIDSIATARHADSDPDLLEIVDLLRKYRDRR
jgi:Ca-activated chloride channel family protein